MKTSYFPDFLYASPSGDRMKFINATKLHRKSGGRRPISLYPTNNAATSEGTPQKTPQRRM
jgi:hypothetical protein